MVLWSASDRSDGVKWYCNTCKVENSIRQDSFFSKSHLPITKLLEILYWWTLDCNLETVSKEIEISEHFLVNWFSLLREVCFVWIDTHPEALGGIDPATGAPRIVEIDESCFFHRKYHRGQMRENCWVFGGVERGTGRCFLQIVARRDAATLIPLIQQWILPRTIIVSDQWASYAGLPNLQQMYQHLTVNHFIEFVNHNDPRAHTQTIEGLWAHVKHKYRTMYGTSHGNFVDYLSQFLWRKQHKNNRFGNLLAAIRSQYN